MKYRNKNNGSILEFTSEFRDVNWECVSIPDSASVEKTETTKKKTKAKPKKKGE